MFINSQVDVILNQNIIYYAKWKGELVKAC